MRKLLPTEMRRLWWMLLMAACAALLVLWFQPIVSKVIRIGQLGVAATLWVLCFTAVRNKAMRVILCLIPLLLAVLFLLPAAKIDAQKVHADYVARLRSYVGTKYVWGGEGSTGIDCSGLPRRSFRDAVRTYGIRQANADALRIYARHWWYDASAKALAAGYQGYAVPLGVTGTIETMDVSSLQEGDLAITKNGVHVMIYLGDDQWIQADPDAGQVIIANGKKDHNLWFNVPVVMHRWALFE